MSAVKRAHYYHCTVERQYWERSGTGDFRVSGEEEMTFIVVADTDIKISDLTGALDPHDTLKTIELITGEVIVL